MDRNSAGNGSLDSLVLGSGGKQLGKSTFRGGAKLASIQQSVAKTGQKGIFSAMAKASRWR